MHNNDTFTPRTPLSLAASLLLAGQVGYIAVTHAHAGGHANEHHEIFETYAHDQIWGVVHLGQFGGMALLLGGLMALAFFLDLEAEPASSRFALRAVDGQAH